MTPEQHANAITVAFSGQTFDKPMDAQFWLADQFKKALEDMLKQAEKSTKVDGMNTWQPIDELNNYICEIFDISADFLSSEGVAVLVVFCNGQAQWVGYSNALNKQPFEPTHFRPLFKSLTEEQGG